MRDSFTFFYNRAGTGHGQNIKTVDLTRLPELTANGEFFNMPELGGFTING